ncbi:MAG: septum formation initiator family protein [Candidatus Pacebacteria bacterium]|nr:septum formation initiator family protein [Candidatus Paceibacterota bacterium]
MPQKRSFLKKRLGLILASFLGLLMISGLLRNIFRLFRAEKEVGRAQEELARLQAEQEELLQKREHVESEAFIEKQARDKLNMAKEGEVVVVLPPDLGQTQEEEALLPTPNWQKWLEVFGW